MSRGPMAVARAILLLMIGAWVAIVWWGGAEDGVSNILVPAAEVTPSDALGDGRLEDDLRSPAGLPGVYDIISQREYFANVNAFGLQAPNRRHNLRTYFDERGIRVHDRTAQDGPVLVDLSIVSMGRGADRMPMMPGEVVHDGARVEIRRSDSTEWFENSPRGLEHGLTLPKRADGAGSLVVEIAVRDAVASRSGDRITFESRSGRRLDYDGLVVRDATGSVLPARFESPSPDRVLLVVVDLRARYPIEIDPVLSDPASATLESDELGAILGVSVSDAGDVNSDGFGDVIVGARYFDGGDHDTGAAFVFMGSASGLTQQHAGSATQLVASQSRAFLGESVAGAGDVNGDGYDDVIVGAFFYSALQFSSGAAFIFHGGPAGIASGTTDAAATQLLGDQIMAYCGSSVSSAGDVNGDGYADVIVGCAQYDVGQADEGAAFVFLGSAAGVPDSTTASPSALLESNQVNSYFGSSVASAGDVNGDGFSDVVVGAPSYTTGAQDGGSAFVFLGSPAGIGNGNPATASAHLSSTFSIDGLGASVSGAGDVNGDGYADIIVGHPRYNVDQGIEGAAFVFLGSSTGVASATTATAHARVKSSQPEAEFGFSVSGAGDLNGDGYADIVVGAKRYDHGSGNEGAAFVFLGGASGIATGDPASAAAQIESDQAGAELGWSVSGAGDVNGDGYSEIIVGAPNFDAGQPDEGAAFLYLGGSLGIQSGSSATAAAQIEANQGNANLGWSVSSAGDVNGDGYSDVVVGAHDFDAGQSNEGAAFVFMGGPSGVADGSPASAPAQLEANQGSADFGRSVSGAGDVNGDGYSDVIVGAPDFDAGQTNEGAAFVFLGSASGIADGNPTTAAAQLESNQANASLGWSVAGVLDVNADGYSDVAVGAHRYDSGELDEGAVFVFAGSASGVADGNPTTAMARLQGNQAGAAFGESVSGPGDVDGDGDAEVLVGAGTYDAGQVDEGAAFLFPGRASGVADGSPQTAATRIEGDQLGAALGRSVAGAGDVNGDGFADVIVGAPDYDSAAIDAGAAFVFHGGPTGVVGGGPLSSPARLVSNQSGSRMGSAVAPAGDLDGDGFADVIVGASAYDSGEIDEGAAFVFRGGPSGIGHLGLLSAAGRLESNQSGAAMGSSVAGTGDVNADGYADALVGAPLFDAGQGNEGAAFLFSSNGSGRPVLARQLRGGASAIPVQSWGASDEGSFEVRLRATDPTGRRRVKLEVEACASADAFGSAACRRHSSPAWIDVSATGSGIDLTESVAGFQSGSLTRWRARVLYAPFTVDRPGIVAAPRPLHGPWRRLSARTLEGDVRTLPEPTGWNAIASGLLSMLALRSRHARRGRFDHRRLK